MKIINWIFDLSASKKKNSPEIKRKISEIIIFDRFEIKESNKCNAEIKHTVKDK